MFGFATKREVEPLNRGERLIAFVVGAGLLGVAVLLVVVPPHREVALSDCPDAAAGCIVRVDSDLTTFAVVLAAAGAVAVLLAILGVRFNQLKVAGAELGYQRETAGLAKAAPAEGEVNTSAPTAIDQSSKNAPVEVEVAAGLGKPLGEVPVAVARLTSPMTNVNPAFLSDYQSARRESQYSYYMTHILGPSTKPGQKYSVAIRVTAHEQPRHQVKSASFFLGRSWGNKAFEGKRGSDGRFGIATEAYGPFLALCEVEFDDGSRILLDHYCDFDMGSLLLSLFVERPSPNSRHFRDCRCAGRSRQLASAPQPRNKTHRVRVTAEFGLIAARPGIPPCLAHDFRVGSVIGMIDSAADEVTARDGYGACSQADDLPWKRLCRIHESLPRKRPPMPLWERRSQSPRTRRSPRATSSMTEAGSWPAGVSRSVLSRVTRAVTLTTESLGRPEMAAGRNTLPGMVARAVLEVMTAAMVVFSRLALKGSDWTTRTGRRLAGLLP